MGATIILKTGEGTLNTMGSTIALGTSEVDQLDGGLELDLTFNFRQAMEFAGGAWWNAGTKTELAERMQGFLDAMEAEREWMMTLAPSNGWGNLDDLAEIARQGLALLEACPDCDFLAF